MLDSPLDVGCIDGRLYSHSFGYMMGKERSAYIGCFYSLVGIILLLVAVLVFGACRSVRYVPIESVRHDSVVTILHHRDSVYQHDSVYIKEKADTLLIERWHTRWRDRVSHDTLYMSKTDTIRIPVPVERKLTKAERTYITIGKWSVGAATGLVLAAICFIFFRRKFSS